MMSHRLTKEEEQLLKLCYEGTAPIREFTALLGRRVRLNIHDQEGNHPLWLVSYHGRSDLADLLIKHGADVDLANTDEDGDTALTIASGRGHLEIIKLLLQRGALINHQRKDGNTALYFASSNNHVDVVKLLLNSGAQVNKGSSTPLYVASLNGRLEITQVLLDHGADVNQPTDVEPCFSPLEIACKNNHLQVAQLLISNGADVDYLDSNGQAPLHRAAGRGHIELVKLPLLSHAKLNVKDNFGYTPLHWAVSSGHIEVVRLLLLSQASMEIKNNAGKTPLQVAEEMKHMEIVHLLKTEVPAQPAEVSVSGEAGDGEEQPSVEALTGELKIIDDCSQLTEMTFNSSMTDEDFFKWLRSRGISDKDCITLSENGVTPGVLLSAEDFDDVGLTKVGKKLFLKVIDEIKGQHADTSERTRQQPHVNETLPSQQPSQASEVILHVATPIMQNQSISLVAAAKQSKFGTSLLSLTKLPKEDYVCVAQNSLCLVYLPQGVNEKLSIETVTDKSLYPRIASNEIIITPVVQVTPDNTSLSLKKPAIIELAKTIELSEKEGDNKVIPLYTKSNYSGWNQLGTGSVVNCRVLQDRISFQVTHFSLYTVISRRPYPSSSVRVKPASATAPPTPDYSSNTHTQLTIPELPGFKVQIPPSRVESDITATILYDCPAVCSEDERSRLASSCIELEPHGITFTKKVSISIPIPDYAEVMKNHPNAQLQIWHSNNRANVGDSHALSDLSWTLVEHSMHQDDEGRYVAIILVNHFSLLKALWIYPQYAPSDAPGELKVSHSLPTTAKLSWSPLQLEEQNGVITGYKVQIVGPDSQQEIQVEDVSVEVSNLKPSTSYTFSVSAMTKAGIGPAANIFTTTPNVPSGYILTKQELQALSILLAPYTDEKLKELKLSIQKEQGDISREEVEKLLRKYGLTTTADRLKEDIEKGVQNLKHYDAYEQALQDGMELTLRYLKFLFLGPPRSGKTSARRRLVREIVNLSNENKPSKSTGVAETNDAIVTRIKKLVYESTEIVNSTWKSIHRLQGGSSSIAKEQKGDLTQLARWFYRIIANAKESVNDAKKRGDDAKKRGDDAKDVVPSDDGESDPSSAADSVPPEVPDSHPGGHSNESEDLDIKAALEELSHILQSDDPVKLEQVLKELIMISMVDVGGQPALMEMLPSLTIGPALYFLFFRLDQELGESYPVRYHAIDSKEETTLESSYCTETVLDQSLSSIACFGCYSQQDNLSSAVLLFGTYKDVVDEERISQMSSTLKEKFLKSKLYEKGLLLKTSKGELFFSLDNMKGNESEMSKIRSDIEKIVKKKFSATPIPAAWLMFRIVLHLLRKPVLSLAQCQAIAKRLSMPTPVEEALWFFHHNIGNMMYYPDIPSMRDIVICDPQVIFDSVSELIFDRFQYSDRSLTSHEVDEFYNKGQFSLAQIEDKTKDQRKGHLKPTQLVDVLIHHNIIAEVTKDNDEPEATAVDQPNPHAPDQSLPPVTDQPQHKFIMPAVLKDASEEDLKVPAITDNQSIPIMICFEDGYVPFGVFCATTAHLIAHQRWELDKNLIMRNKVTFIIDKAFLATIISRGQYLEMYVSRYPRVRKRTSLSLTCLFVRLAVVDSLRAVISKMKFNPYSILQKQGLTVESQQLFSLAFICICGQQKSDNDHLMKVVESSSERYAECLITGVEIDLEKEQTIWFCEEQEQRKQQAILESKAGDAQLEKGNYQLAAESYSKTMELDPSSAVFLVSRAKALFQQQLYLETEESCSMSLALDKNNGKAYLLRAKARAKLGKLEFAIQDFKSTLKLEPGNMEANMHLALLEGEHRRRAKHAKEEGPPKQSPSSLCAVSYQPTPELEVAQTLDAWEISLRNLLGEKVLDTNSRSTGFLVTEFEVEGAVVGLFFSAIWCSPSREFTPKLVGWYKQFKKGPNGHLLFIVFISSDFDYSEFREYRRHMPDFYALDFKDRNKEAKLASRFEVNSTPTLIFVDGKTGKLISKEGRSIVREDPNGEQFPWKPKLFLDIVAGAKLIDRDKEEKEWKELQGKKTIIALFFSAGWCPDQRETLVATYHKLKATRQDFEFIYVSSDETEEEWETSLASMPWPSFCYGDKRPETIRNDSFRINSIPALILLNEEGGIITTKGLTYVLNDPDGKTFPWYVNCLTEYTVINNTAYLIWFVPRASTSRAKEILEPLAKEYISKKARENMEVKLMFFIAGEENETSASIREMARLQRGDPLLAIIDVPRNQVHVADHSELSEVNAKKFMYGYLTRRLMGRRLR